MTHLLESAEQSIKRCNNAGPDHRLVCVGSGSTAAIERLQMILGVHLAPATRALLKAKGIDLRALEPELPVVFLSPYEHHSNELSWREACCQVVKVPSLDASGAMDLAALQRLVRSPEYEGVARAGVGAAAWPLTDPDDPMRPAGGSGRWRCATGRSARHKQELLCCCRPVERIFWTPPFPPTPMMAVVTGRYCPIRSGWSPVAVACQRRLSQSPTTSAVNRLWV